MKGSNSTEWVGLFQNVKDLSDLWSSTTETLEISRTSGKLSCHSTGMLRCYKFTAHWGKHLCHSVEYAGFDQAEFRGVRGQIYTTEGPEVNCLKPVDF